LEKQRLLAGLEGELASAVSGEEYERAAEIRDRIRQLTHPGKEDSLPSTSSSEA
jgi:protein-arginine kinase activator protein McsA